MCIKYSFIFLILFISQSVAHDYDSVDNKRNDSLEGMINEIFILIGELQLVTDITEVQKKVTDLISDTKYHTNIQLEGSSDVIDNISASVFARIVLQRKKIGNCFDEKLKQITAANTQIIGDRNDCINFHHNTGLDWLQNANRTISEIQTQISSITIKFSKCLFEHSDVSGCLWDLFQTIQDWSINLPKIIANIRNNADRIAGEVRGKVTNCYSVSTASSVTQIIGLVVDVSQCLHANANTACEKTDVDSQKSCLALFQNIYLDNEGVTHTILEIYDGIHFMREQLYNLDNMKNKQKINSLYLVNKLYNETKSLMNSFIQENDWRSNTLKCINDLMTKTYIFNNNIINSIKQCQESMVQPTIELILNDIKTLYNITNVIYNYPLELVNCISDISCLTNIFEQLDKISEMTDIISSMMSTVSTEVLLTIGNIENCTYATLNITTQFTSTLMTEIKNCVINDTSTVFDKKQTSYNKTN